MESNNAKPIDLEKKVHKDLKEAFSKFPIVGVSLTNENIEVIRQGFIEKWKTYPQYKSDNVIISTKTIQGSENVPDVSIRIYQPKDTRGNKPGVLWFHGGGFLLGTAEMCDNWCKRAVDEVDCVAISVDYRLAPENPYPAALEDCYAALVWMKDNAEELGIDTKRIVVGGHSAGGGLCAALTLLIRDRGGPEICFQMPIYPMIDDRNVTPSSYQITDPRVWNRHRNITAWKLYLGDKEGEDVPIYAAPARAKDYSNLPPTFLFVGELDPFGDENIEYATKLMQAGVPVEFHVYPGCFHASEGSVSEVEISKKINQTAFDALKNAVKLDQK